MAVQGMEWLLDDTDSSDSETPRQQAKNRSKLMKQMAISDSDEESTLDGDGPAHDVLEQEALSSSSSLRGSIAEEPEYARLPPSGPSRNKGVSPEMATATSEMELRVVSRNSDDTTQQRLLTSHSPLSDVLSSESDEAIPPPSLQIPKPSPLRPEKMEPTDIPVSPVETIQVALSEEALPVFSSVVGEDANESPSMSNGGVDQFSSSTCVSSDAEEEVLPHSSKVDSSLLSPRHSDTLCDADCDVNCCTNPRCVAQHAALKKMKEDLQESEEARRMLQANYDDMRGDFISCDELSMVEKKYLSRISDLERELREHRKVISLLERQGPPVPRADIPQPSIRDRSTRDAINSLENGPAVRLPNDHLFSESKEIGIKRTSSVGVCTDLVADSHTTVKTTRSCQTEFRTVRSVRDAFTTTPASPVLVATLQQTFDVVRSHHGVQCSLVTSPPQELTPNPAKTSKALFDASTATDQLLTAEKGVTASISYRSSDASVQTHHRPDAIMHSAHRDSFMDCAPIAREMLGVCEELNRAQQHCSPSRTSSHVFDSELRMLKEIEQSITRSEAKQVLQRTTLSVSPCRHRKETQRSHPTHIERLRKHCGELLQRLEAAPTVRGTKDEMQEESTQSTLFLTEALRYTDHLQDHAFEITKAKLSLLAVPRRASTLNIQTQTDSTVGSTNEAELAAEVARLNARWKRAQQTFKNAFIALQEENRSLTNSARSTPISSRPSCVVTPSLPEVLGEE